MKTDYLNPGIMKEVVIEAEEAGIHSIGIDKQKVIDTYSIKLNKEFAMTMNMIINENIIKEIPLKNQQRIKYKLIQINFEYGLQVRIKSNKIKIRQIRKTFFGRYIYDIKIESIKDKSTRAWDKVQGKPLSLFFQEEDGMIEIINIK